MGIRSREGASVSPLATLNSADIVSITVLKDATATSIYGARAGKRCDCHHYEARCAR